MDITYQGLRFELPLDGVIQAENFQMSAAFNSHTWVSMLLMMNEEGIEEAIHELWDGANIKIYEEEKLLFSGKVINAQMVPLKGLYYLKVSAVSYTYEWGLEAVSQSFLNLDATYKQVMDKILENQKSADVKDCITDGERIPDFLLQYEETDWNFLIRLASHFQSFLVPDYTADYGRVFFGIPDYEEETELHEETYQTIKDMNRFYQVNLSGELLSQEMMKWEVKTNHPFILAQRIRFRGISTIVTRIRYEVVDGELCRFYELSRRRGCLSRPVKNDHINGMSIPATVKERSGNCVRVHFHIDKEYDASPNVRYFTYAIESSFIYCMPEVGSQVHIYFPSDEEKDAIAVHALRASSIKPSAKSASSGGGYAKNPEEKSFSNVNGAELLLTPNDASLAAEEGKTTIIKLETGGIASIKGKDIDLNAAINLSVGEPIGEGGMAAAKITLEGKTVSFMIGGAGFTLTEEAQIVAALVKITTEDETPPESPRSYEEVEAASTAGKEEYLDGINDKITEEFVQKYEDGRNQAIAGGFKIAGTVVVVTVVIVVTVASLGTATAPAVALASTVTTASAAVTIGTTAAAGVVVVAFADAEITQGLTDVRKSMTGDLSYTENTILDGLFDGNEKAYNMAKALADITFGIVSGKAIASGLKVIGEAGHFFQFACICGKRALADGRAGILGKCGLPGHRNTIFFYWYRAILFVFAGKKKRNTYSALWE